MGPCNQDNNSDNCLHVAVVSISRAKLPDALQPARSPPHPAYLLRVPNEILHQICTFLRPVTHIPHLEGLGMLFGGYDNIKSKPGIYDSVKEYASELSTLRNLALVCPRLAKIVEDHLYPSIALPQYSFYTTIQGYPASRVPFLLRTLIDRPDLASRVRSLAIWVHHQRLVRFDWETLGRLCNNPYNSILQRACQKVSALNLPLADKADLLGQLGAGNEYAVHACVIQMLPALETLRIGQVMHVMQTAYYLADRDEPPVPTREFSVLSAAISRSCITSIRTPLTPIAAMSLRCSTLTTLRVRMDNILGFDKPDLHIPTFPSITTLYLGCYAPYLVYQGFSANGTSPMEALRSLLHHLPGIQTVKVYSSLPFQPKFNGPPAHFEGTILHFDDHPADLEDAPDGSDEAPWGDWGYLLGALEEVKERLQVLELPQAWYSSMGKITGPVHSLKVLKRLRRLSVPKVFLVSNFYETYRESTTPATELLPDSLEELLIYQVDSDVCDWLLEFLEDRVCLEKLKLVKLCFRDGFIPYCTGEFQEKIHRADVQVDAEWQGKQLELG